MDIPELVQPEYTVEQFIASLPEDQREAMREAHHILGEYMMRVRSMLSASTPIKALEHADWVATYSHRAAACSMQLRNGMEHWLATRVDPIRFVHK